MTTQLKRFTSRGGHFMKKNYHLGRQEVAHRLEVKTRERWIQGYGASALEERGHIGHLEIRHYCMFSRFGFEASFK